jgi:predicted GNAT family acetyltransferase
MSEYDLALLDNPIWQALSTRHKDLALSAGQASRYDSDFTSLAGVEEVSPESLAQLAELVEPGGRLGICSHEELPTHPLWKNCGFSMVAQMVCYELLPCRIQSMEMLSAADVTAMTELVKLTKPGPFASRTIEFGQFYGIKDGAQLVAMAGERMKLPGMDEVSAVCTHPDYQGRGYGRALVHAVASNIAARGNLPFLHVRAENAAGLRAYQSIGFTTRKQMHFTLIERL